MSCLQNSFPYAFGKRENWLPYDRQIDYIYQNVTTARMGKDVRLYRAGGFFLEKMEEAVRKSGSAGCRSAPAPGR